MTQRDAKAIAMRSLIRWLEEKCRGYVDTEHGRVRHALLAAWVRAEEAMQTPEDPAPAPAGAGQDRRPQVAPVPAPAGVAEGRRYGPSGPSPSERAPPQPRPAVRTLRSMPGRPRFLSPERQRMLADAVEVACVTHNWLAAESLQLGTNLWKLVPKLHAATHLGYDNRGVNPRAVQCYLDEDMQPASGRAHPIIATG
jgi:hypothetical protein